MPKLPAACFDALTRNRYIISAICVVSIFMASWYPSNKDDTPLTILNESHDAVDYFANNISSTFFDDAGKKEYILKGKRMDHYPNDQKTELTEPRLTLFDKDGRTWEMRADFGDMWESENKIDLSGNIILKEDSNTLNPIIFKTESLTILLKKRFATTQAPVMITRLNDKITALGMNLFLDQKRVEFLSNAKGHYDPNIQGEEKHD